MRIDTAEAFVRLVAIFGDLLDRDGQTLPEDLEEQMLEDPIRACEALNAQALAAGVIDEEADNALAMIYEALPVDDAKSAMDDVVKSRMRRSLASVVATLAERVRAREAAEAAEQARLEAERLEAERLEAERLAAEEAERAAAEAAAAEEGVAVAEVELEGVLSEMAAEEQPKKRRRGRPRKERKADAEATSKDEPVEKSAPPEAEAPLAKAEPAAKPEVAPEAEPAPEPAPAPADDEQTLTADQAAAIMGITKQEVYKLIKAEKLPAFKKGRSWAIPASAVLPA